jgi:hypothetical protein
MTTGLRDTRIRIYSYSDVGSGGYVSSSYAYVAERWGRVEAPGGREATIAGQAGHVVDAVIALGGDATVTPDGLLKDMRTGKYYRVTAVLPRRLVNEVEVYGTNIDDASFTLTGEP